MSEKRLYGIRGAVNVEDTEDSIKKCVGDMCKAVFEENKISSEDIVSIQFTMTDDISALNAATALRKSDCGIDVSKCALFCAEEPKVKNSMPLMIRVLVTAYMNEGSDVKHIFMGKAAALRPDIFKTC
ncbi:chorismate mutase [Treponema parvum]|uniref:chorismate mutase n=1 Tax=Treponema parvum TaxID=138851 RepID=UPI001AEC5B7F|nr:chorismate mutase [Treponema parvum]QTQ16136.1 chorismate mutase [Treponema parvum]